MMMVIPTMIIILSILIKMIDLQAARNLMEAVVLTVKASYVASRMFNNHKQVDFSTKVTAAYAAGICKPPKSSHPTCPPKWKINIKMMIASTASIIIVTIWWQARSPDPTCPPSPVVVWKMRTPEKQPLVRREPPEEVRKMEILRWQKIQVKVANFHQDISQGGSICGCWYLLWPRIASIIFS